MQNFFSPADQVQSPVVESMISIFHVTQHTRKVFMAVCDFFHKPQKKTNCCNTSFFMYLHQWNAWLCDCIGQA